jgi:outer membrane autotransporter protein
MAGTLRSVAGLGARLLAVCCGCLLMLVAGLGNGAAAQGLTLDLYASYPLQVGQNYFQNNSVSGGNYPYAFSLTSGALPTGLAFDPGNGYVAGMPTVAGAFSYTITVTDSSIIPLVASQTMSGTMAPAAPLGFYSGPATTYGAVGDSYWQYTYGTGGIWPYTYTVASGSLPAGTTLNASGGFVEGTATAPGPYSYTINVTDSTVPPQSTTTPAISGNITAMVPLVWGSTPSAYMQVGQPYSQANTATGPGYGYSYFLIGGILPVGTSLDNSTGLVSGTPTTVGPFSYTIYLSVSGTSQSATPQTVSGTIAPPAPKLTLALTLPTKMQVGQPYAQANVVGGGTAPFTFSLPAGAMPAGTTLDPASGMVAGTPTAVGPFNYTIAVIDSAGAPQSATQTVSGSIVPGVPALTLASTPSPTLQAGQSYWQVNFASGGTPAYRYTVTAGRLPAGTALDAGYGFVSGTPTAAGAFNYTVTATDSSTPALSASQSVSGTIISIATTTALSSSVNPAMLGQSVTLTAAVAPSSASGTVAFKDGAATLCAAAAISSGTATCVAAFTSAGAHPIKADYSGSSAYAASTSNVLTLTVSDQRGKTVQAVADFVRRRNDMIMSNQPDGSRQIDRLSDAGGGSSGGSPSAGMTSAGIAGGGPLSALPEAGELSRFKIGGRERQLGMGLNGGLTGTPSAFGLYDDETQSGRGAATSGPVRITGNTDGAMRFGFSTSLRDVARHADEADARKVRSDDGLSFAGGQSAGSAGRPNPFDIWIEGKFANFRDNRTVSNIDGYFGAVTVGTDYVLNRSFLIGALVQFDSMRQRALAQGSDLAGRGWMAGPYATVRLSDNLFWQFRGAWGRSSNEVSPFATYTDSFASTRWLASSTLAGRWSAGGWTARPSASVSYIEDTATAYKDTFGAQIPEIKSTLGQAKAGPELSYRFQAKPDLIIEPRAGLQVIWNFAGSTTAAGFNPANGETGGPGGIRGQAELGLKASAPGGLGFDLSGSYDGIGSNGYSAITGKATMQMPLN